MAYADIGGFGTFALDRNGQHRLDQKQSAPLQPGLSDLQLA